MWTSVIRDMLNIAREDVYKKREVVENFIRHLKKCHEIEAIGKSERYPEIPFNYTERFCFFCKEKRPDISSLFGFFNHIRRVHKEIKYHEDDKEGGGKFTCPFCSSVCD